MTAARRAGRPDRPTLRRRRCLRRVSRRPVGLRIQWCAWKNTALGWTPVEYFEAMTSPRSRPPLSLRVNRIRSPSPALLRTSLLPRGRPWPRPRPLPRRTLRRLRRAHVGVVLGVAGRRLRTLRRRNRAASSMRMLTRGAPTAGAVGVAGTRLRWRDIQVFPRLRLLRCRIPMTMRTRVRDRMTGTRIGPVDVGGGVVVGAGRMSKGMGAMVLTPRMTTVGVGGVGVGVGGVGLSRNRLDRRLRRVAAPKLRRRTSACVC